MGHAGSTRPTSSRKSGLPIRPDWPSTCSAPRPNSARDDSPTTFSIVSRSRPTRPKATPASPFARSPELTFELQDRLAPLDHADQERAEATDLSRPHRPRVKETPPLRSLAPASAGMVVRAARETLHARARTRARAGSRARTGAGSQERRRLCAEADQPIGRPFAERSALASREEGAPDRSQPQGPALQAGRSAKRNKSSVIRGDSLAIREGFRPRRARRSVGRSEAR